MVAAGARDGGGDGEETNSAGGDGIVAEEWGGGDGEETASGGQADD